MTDVENRHRTAITRAALSRPVRVAVDGGIIDESTTVFDYGCGYGEDVDRLTGAGIHATGWDPHFRPDVPKVEADVVNLGYVINVIPSPVERQSVLADAWAHTRRALVVSARLDNERRNLPAGKPFGDGYATAHGAFQKFYSQAELRSWLDAVLDTETVAAAPGVFIAFKDESDQNSYLIRNSRRRGVAVRATKSDVLYSEHRELFDGLIAFFSERGRIPARDESAELQVALAQAVGSLKRAWRVVRTVTPDTDWHALTEERRQDLFVDLALLRLNRRPTFSKLPPSTRHDVRALAGSYKAATAAADELLFSAGDMARVSEAADAAPVGKRLPTALYVHVSALNLLPHRLRVYEGCARWLVGDIYSANIVKLATDQPKISYLEYPDFERDPHPSLRRSTYVRPGRLDVYVRQYEAESNPPILHRKEAFLADDHPAYDKFKRLSAQEERYGLYDTDTRLIGNKVGWEERLLACGVDLQGHRVVKRR